MQDTSSARSSSPRSSALLVLMFLPRSQKKLVRLWANIVRRCRVARLHPARPELRPQCRGMQFVERRRLDPFARRPVPHRRRRHQPADGDAHHRHGLPRHPLFVERHQGPREGILRHVPAAADGHDGRVHLAGLLAVLCLLGDGAGADVLHHRCVGRPPQALRRHQILPVHAGRLGPDAARHPDPLLPALSASSASTPSRSPS